MRSWTERYKSWEGTAGELAEALTELLQQQRWASEEPPPNVRLLRHYTQLGVLDRPVRRGKEAIYSFRQLVQYLAARWLLLDGWLLAKIAEETSLRSTEALLSLLPGGTTRNPAQDLIARFRADSRPKAKRPSPPPAPSTLERASWRSGQRARLERALAALGSRSGSVRRRDAVVLELTEWCQVTIDTDRITSLTDAEAAMLGDALAATLLDVHRRGGP
jgi:hypothetical protein